MDVIEGWNSKFNWLLFWGPSRVIARSVQITGRIVFCQVLGICKLHRWTNWWEESRWQPFWYSDTSRVELEMIPQKFKVILISNERSNNIGTQFSLSQHHHWLCVSTNCVPILFDRSLLNQITLNFCRIISSSTLGVSERLPSWFLSSICS